MRFRSSLGVALISVSVLAPAVVARPFNWSGIIDKFKKEFKQIFDVGLGDIAASMEKESKDLLSGVFPASPGQPFPADLLPQIAYFAEFASASYCDETHVVGTETKCKDQFCPTLTKNTVFTEANFANQGDSDTTGIVTRDDTTKTIVLAYRGSQSIRNWFTNARVGLLPAEDWCAGCKVHSGFLDAFQDEQQTVLDAIKRLRQENPDYKLVITGHSLGGAVATLAAAVFRKQGLELTLYTFGSPRVGNEALAKYISASGTNFRVTHLNDPVPRLPPLTLGYRHIEPEYHIFSGDAPVGPENIKVFAGTVNFQGNTGFGGLLNFNTSAHRSYILPVRFSGCDDATREGIEFK